jgi:hypothetical protein
MRQTLGLPADETSLLLSIFGRWGIVGKDLFDVSGECESRGRFESDPSLSIQSHQPETKALGSRVYERTE